MATKSPPSARTLAMVEQLTGAIRRVGEQKARRRFAEALETLAHAREEIFGPLAEKVADASAADAAAMFEEREALGVYAALVTQEADIERAARQEERASELYDRAIGLHLASLKLHPARQEQTKMAIRAIRAKVSDAELTQKVRAALVELDRSS